MKYGVNRKLFAVVLAGCVAPLVYAGDTTKAFQGEASVNVIEVPVRVVDSHTGETVIGLRAEDFRIFDGGEPREITNFLEIGSAVTVPGVAAGRSASERALRTRQMIYFFDLYLMMGDERDRALRALAEQYSKGVEGAEEISVVSFDGTLRTHLDRSRDRRRILRSLDEVGEIRSRGLDQSVAFTSGLSNSPVSGERDLDYYERRHRNREYMVELERRVTRVGDAIAHTMARFHSTDGRKALVVFSPGQPETSWSPSYSPVDFLNAEVTYPVQDLWRDVALQASDLGFTLYVIDTKAMKTSSAQDATVGLDREVLDSMNGTVIGNRQNAPSEEITDGATTAPGDLDAIGAAPQNLGQWLERTRKHLLRSAADLTGGHAYFATDAEKAILKVEKELGHWYSLAYVVEHEGDNREYAIKVTLPNHPKYEVVHRMSYLDRPISDREAGDVRSAMLFGGDANPLGVRVETDAHDSRFRLGAVGSKRVQVPFVIKIPIGRLDMIPRGDVYWGKVLITLFGTDQHGNQSRLASQEQPITVSTDQFHNAAMRGFFSYKVTVEVEGGKQTIYIGVKDQISGKLSVVPQEFEF